jgi:hypothetical protein
MSSAPETLESLVRHPAINRFLSAYGRRLLISYKALWVSSFFLAVLICLVLYYLGTELAAGNNVIADVLIYFVVLNFLLVQVRSFSSSVTKIRVFQPFAERYTHFIDSLQHQEHAGDAQFTLSAARNEHGETVPDRVVLPGERIGAIFAGTIDKIALGEIFYSLGVGFAPELAPYVCQYDPDSATRDQLASEYLGQYRELLSQEDCNGLIEILDSDLSGLASAEPAASEGVHRRAWLVLQIAECIWNSTNSVCLMDARSLRGLRMKQLQEIGQLLKTRITIVVYAAVPEKAAFSVSGYYLCDRPLISSEEVLAVDETELL